MNIRFHNTLTKRLEPFEPIDPPLVTMYNCGPTVYDYAHIGNFRTFLFADLLRRTLELAGCRVRQVMNITDVGHMTEDDVADGAGEDKMQLAARRLKEAKKAGQAPVDDPDDPYQVADYYAKAFIQDAHLLGLKVVDDDARMMPRATQYIDAMQRMIQTLIDRGHAYVAADRCVYYSVQTFPDYGRLSGNTLDQLRDGAGGRLLDEHQAVKKHPADFLLWKPDAAHIMKWPSPWGDGYPGWHIECSAMSREVLGQDVIDIHTSAEDNIFPHHECEIAQSRGCTGADAFARLWMHARHLMVDGQKMSKSKGTFFTVRDLVADGVDPKALRYELIKSHYRSNMNFTRQGLADSGRAVARLRQRQAELDEIGAMAANVDLSHPVIAQFAAALADDLNISAALAVVFKWLAEPVTDAAEAAGVLAKIDSVLAVVEPAADAPTRGLSEADARNLAHQIDEARAGRNYAAADALRQTLIDAGYAVKTTKDGTAVTRTLA